MASKSIKHNPMAVAVLTCRVFGEKAVKAKKGKGSYTRKGRS